MNDYATLKRVQGDVIQEKVNKMANSIYSDKKGIYKDLYRTLDSDRQAESAIKCSRQRKGIYKNLYRQLEEDKVTFNQNQQAKNDGFKKTDKIPLKAFAYTSNVGEALRPILSALLVKLSLIPSVIYTIISVLFSAFTAKNEQEKQHNVSKEFISQVLANFLLPDLLVRAARKTSNKLINIIPEKIKQNIKNSLDNINILSLLNRQKSIKYRQLGLSGVGLLTLAVAVKPIDNFVGYSLNRMYNYKGSAYDRR